MITVVAASPSSDVDSPARVSDHACVQPVFERATLAFQRAHVARVLAACGGHRERAATLLGLPPATFYRHLKRLEVKGFRPVTSDA